MDEDELADLKQKSLQAHTDYDTFGTTAAELARKAAAADAQSRSAEVPTLIPEEVVAPVADSIGASLICHVCVCP